jgi:hypothetical protein
MLVIMNLRLVHGVVMVVRTMVSLVVVVMHLSSPGVCMLVAVFVKMFVRVFVRMLMDVFRVSVQMLVRVAMSVAVRMQMLVLVFSFHRQSSYS